MTITPDPIEWVTRPDNLAHVKNAFGVYVVGDSMEPRYEQGDLITVHPTKPPSNGADVLVLASHPTGETAALVKRLVKVTPSHWIVRQFNPPGEMKLDRQEWQVCMLIVGRQNGG